MSRRLPQTTKTLTISFENHEIELHIGNNDWWLIAVGGDFEQPIDENLHASAVEIDTKFALIKRMGDGIAVSFQLRYGRR